MSPTKHRVIGVFLAYLAMCPVEALDCPANCKCAWVLDSLEVNCARSGLTEYPSLSQIPVEHLDLSFNNFAEFPTHLSEIESLIYLDLSNNRIEFIDADALVGFHSLRTLLLANNSITGWKRINPSEAFLKAGNLKRLSLSGNHLESFTGENPKLLLQSQSLIHLELERCNITAIGGDQLVNGLPILEQLTLSNNALTSLGAIPSTSLRVLELSNCKLSHFGSSMLIGLPSLEALNLSWNMGLQFDDVLFSAALTHLDVSYSNLDSIDLTGLPNLSTLRLRSNVLREISGQTFANNTQLEVIDLSRNSLRLIAAEAFVRLKRLVRLDLSYNEISRIDRATFRSSEKLSSLDLSRNVFEKCPNLVSNSLRNINLSWCEILTIDSSTLSGLSAIQSFDLSNNFLREFPSSMRSETLQEINLSNCRLTGLRNNSLRGFPELASLRLNGNRFTNPFAVDLFKANKYLDQIWLGDNPWICNCHANEFIEFHEFLTMKPPKLRDRLNVRCASPTYFYGLTWESACRSVWLPLANRSSGEKTFTIIMFLILGVGGLVVLITFAQKYLRKRKERRNRREYRRNQEEMREIRRENQRILQREAAPNAPSAYETNLPSYEDALLMPKLERPVKSMLDLTASARARKRLTRSRTDPEGNADNDNDLLLDIHHRFRSEEMLSNRDKERTAQIIPHRRTGHIAHNNSGSRRFSIEDSRFVASHFKAQNLQSAEQIANFQSYENSPYTKRKPKIAEIPPFKRATLTADSVEFLTDPEFDADLGKPASPFARRNPKTPPTPTPTPTNPSSGGAPSPKNGTICNVSLTNLAAVVEDHFGSEQKSSASSSAGSNFDMIVRPEVASLPENSASSSDGGGINEPTSRGKRTKKRRNSSSRRASGNFTNANGSSSSSSETEPIVLVHKPMRETIF